MNFNSAFLQLNALDGSFISLITISPISFKAMSKAPVYEEKNILSTLLDALCSAIG